MTMRVRRTDASSGETLAHARRRTHMRARTLTPLGATFVGEVGNQTHARLNKQLPVARFAGRASAPGDDVADLHLLHVTHTSGFAGGNRNASMSLCQRCRPRAQAGDTPMRSEQTNMVRISSMPPPKQQH